jgi:uncharacterized protein (TIGR02996 family)
LKPVTTEDDFQRVLDRRPADWQTRLVLADWLQERDDPRAEGYRALGLRRVLPTKGNRPKAKTHYWVSDSEMRSLIYSFGTEVVGICGAALPKDWCRKIYYGVSVEKRGRWNTGAGWYGYAPSRREADDAAAVAFSKLKPERRAELLSMEVVAQEMRARVNAHRAATRKKRKSKKPMKRTRKK